MALDEIGLIAGFALLDSPSRPLITGLWPGGPDGTGHMQMRGVWTGAQAQFAIWPWFRVAGRFRVSSLSYGPRIAADPSRFEPGRDLSALDPQFGDPRLGGSVAFLVRLIANRAAIDFGFTRAWGTLRSRGTAGVPYANAGGDSASDQTGYAALTRELTLRVSRTGPGFFVGVGLGESFVNLPQPGFEALLGWRSVDYHLLGGFGLFYGPGLVVGAGRRLFGNFWLGAGGLAGPGFTGLLTLSHRWTDDAPL